MPIGTGFLQIVRSDQQDTYATLTCVPSDGYTGCKEFIEFTAEIKSTLTDDFVQFGWCQIIRSSDNYAVYDQEILGDFPVVVEMTGLIDGYDTYYVNFYDKVYGLYRSCVSSLMSFYVEPEPTVIEISVSTPTTFNHNDDTNLIATVSCSFELPGGTMVFKVYSEDSELVFEDEVELSADTATTTVPGNTVTTGNYFVSAIYSGNSCINPGATPPGMAGYQITAT